MSRARKTPIAPIIIGVVGCAILIALGTWQVQRLAWKKGVIAGIEERLAADPVAVPDAVSEAEHHRLRVTAQGRMGKRELHVLTSIKRIGPGFRVVVPMELGDDAEGTGRWIMVDLGFVPERLKKPMTRTDSVRWRKRLYHDRVTGLLYWPEDVDSFTPDPDIDGNLWFARDIGRMAEVLETDPVLLIAEAHPDSAEGAKWPLPRPPGVDVPNRHLEYALTWYGLGLVWAVMSIVWFRGEWRKARAAT
ncbi:MAG: SURF1 family protein [Pseudomonadota bacterium]